MLKVPSFNRCVRFVLNVSKKWQKNLHALFTMKDLTEQISVDIASWSIIRALNLSDADDEGFEDEDYDWLPCLIYWHLSDQVYI